MFLHNKTSEGLSIGIFIQIPSIDLAEIFLMAGFDFLLLDLEHGFMGTGDVRQITRTVRTLNKTCWVRVPKTEPAMISRVLDWDVDAVVVPQINSLSELEEIISIAAFPPIGKRGFCSAVREFNYLGAPHMVQQAKPRIIPLIETRQAANNMTDFISCPHIDTLFIGPGDLSTDMGYAGDWQNEEMQTILQDLVAQVVNSAKHCIFHAKTPGDAYKWYERGVTMMTYGIDSQLLLKTLISLRQQLYIKK